MSKLANEKLKQDGPLLPSSAPQLRPSIPSYPLRVLLSFCFLGFFGLHYYLFQLSWPWERQATAYDSKQADCDQADVLIPEKNGALWDSLTAVYGTDAFQSRAVDWLGGAVKVP